tara:strand:- start:2523 stop:3626 length:1104 start_codon:yes stop_codon:yes gene_type:complete
MGRLENILSAGFSVILAIVLLVHFVPDAEPEQSQNDHKAPIMPRASIVKIPMKTVELPPPPDIAAEAFPAKIAKRLEPEMPIKTTKNIVPLQPKVRKTEPQKNKVVPLKPTVKSFERLKTRMASPLKPDNRANPQEKTPAISSDVKPQTAKLSKSLEDKDIISRSKKLTNGQKLTVGRKNMSTLVDTGRPLLRLLEHGDGPSIDISWPANSRERKALFEIFEKCYGMVVALISRNGDLHSHLSQRAPWEINLDYYSGFVRQSGDLSTASEREWTRRIVKMHPHAAGSVPVRLFPRETDALLMGGLQKLLNGFYRSTKSITARYARKGKRVLIEDIKADGRGVRGRIDLSSVLRRTCRNSTGRVGEST